MRHFDVLRAKEAEFHRRVRDSINRSAAAGAAGQLAGERQAGVQRGKVKPDG